MWPNRMDGNWNEARDLCWYGVVLMALMLLLFRGFAVAVPFDVEFHTNKRFHLILQTSIACHLFYKHERECKHKNLTKIATTIPTYPTYEYNRQQRHQEILRMSTLLRRSYLHK